MTESGKSTLARQVFLSAAAPRLVISPSDDDVTEIPGAVTFRDPARVPEDAQTARFVPRDPGDLDAYDAVFRWAFGHFPRYVWVDEAGMVLPAQGWPRWGGTLVVQGRKRQLGLIACHTRPIEVAKNLVAQAHHVIAFDLPAPEDRQYVAKGAGVPVDVFEAELGQLPTFGFLWWDRRAKQLTAVPGLQP